MSLNKTSDLDHLLTTWTPHPRPTPAWFAKPGEKVRFLGRNGHDFELRETLSLFDVGDELVVTGGRVGGCKSSYRFEGYSCSFNTVMFEMVRKDEPAPAPDRPTKLYHSTTPKKAARYRESGFIKSPVRGFTTLEAAMLWSMKVGRSVVYEVEAPADVTHKLPDHHNEFGEAWWIDRDVAEYKCVVSA